MPPKQSNELLKNILKKPIQDKGDNIPHYPEFIKNWYHQADLLFLPTDDNFKYALVVVDVGSRATDARPLKSKESSEIIRAFKSIYGTENKPGQYLSPPHLISVDSGSEFKGDVGEYLKTITVHVKTALPGRHRQQAFVERKNRDIGMQLNKRMLAEELLTGDHSMAWVDDLPVVIKDINTRSKNNDDKKILHNKKFPVDNSKPQNYLGNADALKLLEQGTKVRVALDAPKDVIDGKRLHGKFREGDIRYDLKPRTIIKTLIAPGTTPMYQLDDANGEPDNRALYTKNQLQVIPKNEILPDASLIRGNKVNGVNKFIIEKLLKRETINNKIMFEVKWKGDSTTTLEPRSTLIIDAKDMVLEFEKNIKKGIQ